jgi:hypothetical protein
VGPASSKDCRVALRTGLEIRDGSLILIGASSLDLDGGNSCAKFFFPRNLFHWPLIGDVLM